MIIFSSVFLAKNVCVYKTFLIKAKIFSMMYLNQQQKKKGKTHKINNNNIEMSGSV